MKNNGILRIYPYKSKQNNDYFMAFHNGIFKFVTIYNGFTGVLQKTKSINKEKEYFRYTGEFEANDKAIVIGEYGKGLYNLQV